MCRQETTESAAIDCSMEISPLSVALLGDFLTQVEVVPAYDGISHRPFAGSGNLLFLPVSLQDFTSLTDGNFTRKAVGVLDFVELLLDGLTELEIMDVAENEDEDLRIRPKALRAV